MIDLRKCEVCGKRVNRHTMKVYIVERKEPLWFRTQSYYCTDCTRCGARIVLKQKFDGVVVTPSESEENDQ